MIMIVFELTMPHVGSWNNKWAGADRRYIRVYYDKSVPKEYWGKDFYYRWSDGWEACVSVKHVHYTEANKLRKISAGFYGYDWMIDSIIQKGKIEKRKD